MLNLRSRINSPYKINPGKHSYGTNVDLNSVHSSSQVMNSYYSPLEDADGSSKNSKRNVTSLKPNKTRNRIYSNQSFDSELLNSQCKYSSDADLSYFNYSSQKNDDIKGSKPQSKGIIRQFILKKVDLQKLTNQYQQNYILSKQSEQTTCSPNINSDSIKLEDQNDIRSRLSTLDLVKTNQKQFDSSQTTDYSDDNSTELIQQQRNSQEFDQKQISKVQPAQKVKDTHQQEDQDDVSDDESEEEYNIWPNNSEVLMRGIDFENFTDNCNQAYFPQVIYKVRSVFYNQFSQAHKSTYNLNISNDTNKKNKPVKPIINSQNQYKELLEYIPDDKKIQQDYLTLKEFSMFYERRKKRNIERQPSPKKVKNHFIIQMEREKFFQNIQIHQGIQQTPQFQAFQSYFNKYRKTEQMKQRPAKYCRYPQTTSQNNESCTQILRRLRSPSSIQGTPNKSFIINKSKVRNASNFSSFINIEDQNSPIITYEKNRSKSNAHRNKNLNNSILISKQLRQDATNPKSKLLKKHYNNIFDDIVIESKF